MQPTGTECAGSQCHRLAERVAHLEHAVTWRDKALTDLCERNGELITLRRELEAARATIDAYGANYAELVKLAERLEGERDQWHESADRWRESADRSGAVANDLTRRVRELEAANCELEAALERARWTLHSEAKCKARIDELEAECERMHRRCHDLAAFEPIPGKTLRFSNPRYVLIKRPGHCSVTDHVPEWVEVKL